VEEQGCSVVVVVAGDGVGVNVFAFGGCTVGFLWGRSVHPSVWSQPPLSFTGFVSFGGVHHGHPSGQAPLLEGCWAVCCVPRSVGSSVRKDGESFWRMPHSSTFTMVAPRQTI